MKLIAIMVKHHNLWHDFVNETHVHTHVFAIAAVRFTCYMTISICRSHFKEVVF